MDLTVMRATERHREFIAHFATERPRLREPQMVWIGRPATAYKTGLFDHVPDMARSRIRRGSGNARMLLSTSDIPVLSVMP